MSFNWEQETERVVEFIRDYYKKNNLKGAILGISGGKDSGVVAGLMVRALGKENVLGVWMPCHSKEEDKADAKLVSDHYGFKLIDYDLTNVYDTFKSNLSSVGVFDNSQTLNSDINIKPRLRMATLYYLAALYSELKGGEYLVIGTSNKCELHVGYFTKGGDSVHDIAPIADFTVDEVIAIGEYIGVPAKVLYKTPDDGLSNKSDEDKLGVTYKQIAKRMNGEELPEDVAAKIDAMHRRNMHKFNIPTYRKSNT